MQVDINILVGKLSQKIANLEVESALKEATIEALQKELTDLKEVQVEGRKVEG
jgi:uncharacterized coiled-coil protein SlyX